MPYSIRKVGKKYQVYNTATGEIHSKGTTKKKAEGQFRLLQGLMAEEGGMQRRRRNAPRRLEPITEVSAPPPTPPPTPRPPTPPPRFYTDLGKNVGEKTPPVKRELTNAIKLMNETRRNIHRDYWKIEHEIYPKATETEREELKEELDRLGKTDFQIENDAKELQKIITEMGSLTASGRRRGGANKRSYIGGSRADIARITGEMTRLANEAEQRNNQIAELQQQQSFLVHMPFATGMIAMMRQELSDEISTLLQEIVEIGNSIRALDAQRTQLIRQSAEEGDVIDIGDDRRDDDDSDMRGVTTSIPATAGRRRGGGKRKRERKIRTEEQINADIESLGETYTDVRDRIDRRLQEIALEIHVISVQMINNPNRPNRDALERLYNNLTTEHNQFVGFRDDIHRRYLDKLTELHEEALNNEDVPVTKITKNNDDDDNNDAGMVGTGRRRGGELGEIAKYIRAKTRGAGQYSTASPQYQPRRFL